MASSWVLPSLETSGVNSKNVLPVIIAAFRKWASPLLPVPEGGIQVHGFFVLFCFEPVGPSNGKTPRERNETKNTPHFLTVTTQLEGGEQGSN